MTDTPTPETPALPKPVAWAYVIDGKVYALSTNQSVQCPDGLVPAAQMQALADRLAECEAALDSDPHGSGLWRFWSSKSCEISQRNVELLDRATTAEAALATAEKERDAAHNEALETAAGALAPACKATGGHFVVARGIVLSLKKETPNADK